MNTELKLSNLRGKTRWLSWNMDEPYIKGQARGATYIMPLMANIQFREK